MSFDYQVFFMDGISVNEAITENEDGSYTIFVNNDLCESKRMRAVEHTLYHIENYDFGKGDVQEIESKAHKGIN